MIKSQVAIIDIGMGNLQSVKNVCAHLGVSAHIVNTGMHLNDYSHVILPGVGSFSQGMQNLRERDFEMELNHFANESNRFLLGICLGMQLFADVGFEGGRSSGLGLIPGQVKRIESEQLRVPHVGWNDIRIKKETLLIPKQLAGDYYFVHSYTYLPEENDDVLATCEYENEFACAISRDNIYGVQFHPEKSHDLGIAMMRNFLNLGAPTS
jgi:glutamine amidotransferase